MKKILEIFKSKKKPVKKRKTGPKDFTGMVIQLSREDSKFLKQVQAAEIVKHGERRTMSAILMDVFRNGKVPFLENRKFDIKL
jgi:hypothetical protein